MYERILQQMREKIRSRQYVMTLHAEEEMDEDELSIFDVESLILTGKITERQRIRKQPNGSTSLKAEQLKEASPV